MKRWWPALSMVIVLLAAGAWYTYATRGEHMFLAELWAPGLASSIFTMALTILFVNVLLEMSERRVNKRAQEAEKVRIEAEEKLTHARKVLRITRRKRAIQEFLGHET